MMGIPSSALRAAGVRVAGAGTTKGRNTTGVSFTVPVRPIGAPRMTRADKWKQRECVLRYRAFKDRLREAAGEVPPADQVASLSWVACFEPPPSWSKRKRQAAIGKPHRLKPDRDNIDKAILDTLYPGGDQGIASGTIRKQWADADELRIEIQLNDEIAEAKR